ncbi:hypothetical protein Hanom_Chr09g00851741 [Helianthus anomalus]
MFDPNPSHNLNRTRSDRSEPRLKPVELELAELYPSRNSTSTTAVTTVAGVSSVGCHRRPPPTLKTPEPADTN